MFAKLPLLLLTGLALFQSTSAQTTTLNIFPGDADAVENLEGKVLGTGAEGTSYAVSGIVSNIPVTATIVLGSTYLSQVVGGSTQGVEVEVNQECSLDDGNTGLCTAVIKGEGQGRETATTITGPASLTFAPVAIDLSASNANRVVSPLPILMAVVGAAPLLGFIVSLW